MHIKFLKHGTGSAAGASAYLLKDTDHLGTKRERVEVLRGDPGMVAAIADGLPFLHRYTSGVVSWSPEEQPTPEEIDGVLDDLEKVFSAGLDDPARVAWSAVLHSEQGGGVHVHLLVARVDLETGKSLNVAPPGWERTYDPLRDTWNWEKGWARPDDPGRARLGREDGHVALMEASALRAGLGIEPHPKALIAQFLTAQVEAGLIQNRQDMVAALKGAGLEITRQGKDYLTVLDPETEKRYRLKGALYAEGFTSQEYQQLERTAQPEVGAGLGRGGIVDKEQARRTRGKLDQAIARIAEYRNRRYRIKPKATAEVDRLDAQSLGDISNIGSSVDFDSFMDRMEVLGEREDERIGNETAKVFAELDERHAANAEIIQRFNSVSRTIGTAAGYGDKSSGRFAESTSGISHTIRRIGERVQEIGEGIAAFAKSIAQRCEDYLQVMRHVVPTVAVERPAAKPTPVGNLKDFAAAYERITPAPPRHAAPVGNLKGFAEAYDRIGSEPERPKPAPEPTAEPPAPVPSKPAPEPPASPPMRFRH